MTGGSRTETVAAYTDELGRLVEIDHLGVCFPDQAGTYAVYRDGEQTAEFCPGHDLFDVVRPDQIGRAELISLAKDAVCAVDQEPEDSGA